jgi:hypothetical protein
MSGLLTGACWAAYLLRLSGTRGQVGLRHKARAAVHCRETSQNMLTPELSISTLGLEGAVHSQ